MNAINKKITDIQKRTDMDLLDRSVVGLIIYALLWPLIFIPVGFHIQQPMISWGLAAGFASLSLLRLTLKILTDSVYDKAPKRWLSSFAILSIGQAILWGVLFVLTLLDNRMDPVRYTTGLAVAGLCAGAMIALAPRLWIGIFHVFCILVPGIFVSAFITHDYSMTILLCVYFAYLLILGNRSSEEYHRAFRVENQLEAQRKELEILNKIDPLTMIYNRGHFNTAYELQWNMGIRNKQMLSLLLIDIDHFKIINDNHGHLCGDQCLVHIANIIHSIAQRKTDVIARFGGEEFIVLLGNTKLEAACDLAETIRAEIESKPYTFEETEIRITASIGIAAMLPSADSNPNTLIEMTDKALYQAKDEGRNCIRSTTTH